MNRRTFLAALVRATSAAAVASVFPVPQLGRGPWMGSATELAFTQGPPGPDVTIESVLALMRRIRMDHSASFHQQYVLPSMVRSARETLALFSMVDPTP